MKFLFVEIFKFIVTLLLRNSWLRYFLNIISMLLT